MATAARSLRFGSVLRGFAGWSDVCAARRKARAVLASPLDAWASSSASRAFRSWRSAAGARGLMATAARSLRFGSVLRGFAGWSDVCAARRKARAALASPLDAWASSSASRAFRSWRSTAGARGLMATVARHFKFGALSRGFAGWSDVCVARRMARAALAPPLDVWASSSASRAFRSWRSTAGARGLMATAARQLRLGSLLRGFAGWSAVCAARRKARAALASSLDVWASSSGARAFRKWRASAGARGLMATAARHLQSGALLRGFADLADAVAARNKARAALASPLDVWASSSGARALRSWRAQARARGLIAVAARHFMSGELFRRFAGWSDAAASHSISARAAFALLLSGGSTVSSLRTWHARSRARALARAAVPHALGCRLARGFDSWAEWTTAVDDQRLSADSSRTRWSVAALSLAFERWFDRKGARARRLGQLATGVLARTRVRAGGSLDVWAAAARYLRVGRSQRRECLRLAAIIAMDAGMRALAVAALAARRNTADSVAASRSALGVALRIWVQTFHTALLVTAISEGARLHASFVAKRAVLGFFKVRVLAWLRVRGEREQQQVEALYAAFRRWSTVCRRAARAPPTPPAWREELARAFRRLDVHALYAKRARAQLALAAAHARIAGGDAALRALCQFAVARHQKRTADRAGSRA
jgi:hypothetical protein